MGMHFCSLHSFELSRSDTRRSCSRLHKKTDAAAAALCCRFQTKTVHPSRGHELNITETRCSFLNMYLNRAAARRRLAVAAIALHSIARQFKDSAPSTAPAAWVVWEVECLEQSLCSYHLSPLFITILRRPLLGNMPVPFLLLNHPNNIAPQQALHKRPSHLPQPMRQLQVPLLRCWRRCRPSASPCPA